MRKQKYARRIVDKNVSNSIPISPNDSVINKIIKDEAFEQISMVDIKDPDLEIIESLPEIKENIENVINKDVIRELLTMFEIDAILKDPITCIKEYKKQLDKQNTQLQSAIDFQEFDQIISDNNKEIDEFINDIVANDTPHNIIKIDE